MPIPKKSARIGAAKRVEFTLVKALTSIREGQYKSHGGEKPRYTVGAREMVVLGKLINSWKDIVGLQLARKTCPTRLIRGKLYLSVADSQWMQTLIFYKSEMLEKIMAVFPDIEVSDVVGRLGEIPTEVEKLLKNSDWPAWEKESSVNFDKNCDSELAQIADRCARKGWARLRGLLDRGFKLCQKCNANVTQSEDGVCAVCRFESHVQSRSRARNIIQEMPWLTFDELFEIDEQFNKVEIESIRYRLFEETLKYVEELAVEYFDEREEAVSRRLSREMTRAVMLHCGCMPDEVNLDNLTEDQIPSPRWQGMLDLLTGDHEC